jgi:hypothetical protein
MEASKIHFPPQAAETMSNPLTMFMRQPKIYMKLPSGGAFWPQGSIVIPETGQLPVYSMTAKDEILMNIPDALMNGQAVVDVIQNCIPNIKNAWLTPSIDLDAILVAIRIATYGEMMTTPIKFNDDVEMDFKIDLRTVLDGIMQSAQWDSAIPINNEITIFVKPANYKQLTEASLQSFETQKIIQLTNDNSINDDDKIRMFKESFAKLTNATVGMIVASISHIDTINGGTEDPKHIKEYIDNVDKEVFGIIQGHLENLKIQNSIKPMTVAVTDEMREKGITGDTVEVPLVFDASTFFV